MEEPQHDEIAQKLLAELSPNPNHPRYSERLCFFLPPERRHVHKNLFYSWTYFKRDDGSVHPYTVLTSQTPRNNQVLSTNLNQLSGRNLRWLRIDPLKICKSKSMHDTARAELATAVTHLLLERINEQPPDRDLINRHESYLPELTRMRG